LHFLNIIGTGSAYIVCKIFHIKKTFFVEKLYLLIECKGLQTILKEYLKETINIEAQHIVAI